MSAVVCVERAGEITVLRMTAGEDRFTMCRVILRVRAELIARNERALRPRALPRATPETPRLKDMALHHCP